MNRALLAGLICLGLCAAGLAALVTTTASRTSAFDSPEPEPVAFSTACAERGGEVLEDTLSRTVTAPATGTVTGTVITSDGKVTIGTGTGSGIGTAYVTITVRQCVVDGEVVDMEVTD